MIILERSADGFRRAFFSPGWENAIVKKIVQKEIQKNTLKNEERNTEIFGI